VDYHVAMSSPFAQPPRRRITIAHLMLWTLGCAIALGLYRANYLADQSDTRLSGILQYYFLLNSIPAGARIGAVLLFGWMIYRGDKSFPTQPGHWLLLNEGVYVLLVWLAGAAIVVFTGDRRPNALWIAAHVPSSVATAVLYVVGLIAISREDRVWNGARVHRSGTGWRLVDTSGGNRLWKVAFWLLLLEHAMGAVAFGSITIYFLAGNILGAPIPWRLMSLNTYCAPVLLLVLPVATFTDPHRSRRDFLHWTGIMAAVATDLLNMGGRWVIIYWR